VNYEFVLRCIQDPWDFGCGRSPRAGTLSWGDGEAGDREISVPTNNGSALLVLREPAGGASLANRVSVLHVDGDIPVNGAVSFESRTISATEGQFNGPNQTSVVQLTLRREFIAAGAISVTVTPVAHTALAKVDFAAASEVVHWGDGDFSPKTVTITLVDDRQREDVERFTFVLENPTNGALLWGPPIATVTINDDDRSRGSGGGTLGLASALLLGLGNLLRRALGRRGRAGTQSAVT
jgi:hypothetical protein